MSLELVESIKLIAKEIAREFTESINANTEAHNKLLQFYMDNPHIIGASGADENTDQNGGGSGQDSGDGSADSGGSESARESGGGDSGSGENNSGDSVKNTESGESAGKPSFLSRSAPKIPVMDVDQFLDYVIGNMSRMQKNKDDLELCTSIETALWDYCQLHGGGRLEEIKLENVPAILAALWDGWGKYFDEKAPNKDFTKLFELVKPQQS